MKFTTGCCLIGTLLGLSLWTSVASAAMPEPPKTSSYAAAEDLGKQLEGFVKGLEEAVADEAAYKDAESRVPKDANTVLLLALALGMHDSDNSYKAAAPGLVEAAKKLMAAKDYASAKAGADAVKAAMTSKGDASKLSWDTAQDASLAALMQQVPLINAKLKRNIKQLKKKGDDARGQVAVIAVIGQGSMALAAKTSKPDQAADWYKHCAQMRDAAGAAGAGIQAKDEKAVEKAMKDMAQSCDDCHEIFNQQAKAAGK